MMKTGYAGEDQARSVFPTVIGHTPGYILKHYNLQEYYVGYGIIELQDELREMLKIFQAKLDDWYDMLRIWMYILYYDLGIAPDEHPVLLTDSPNNPRQNREKMAEILFETLEVPALAIVSTAALSLYASGRTTGLIVDIGGEETKIIPIYENMAMDSAFNRFLGIGGQEITKNLKSLLRERGYTFESTPLPETVGIIKEKLCYIALDPECQLELVRKNQGIKQYTFQDGNIVDLGIERFLAPEVLFNPAAIGNDNSPLHEAIYNCIQNCETNIQQELYQNIILSGGSSMFPGLKERLQKELTRMVPQTTKIQVIASPERKFASWIGGSMLASQKFSSNLWIRREDYQKYGTGVARQGMFPKLFSQTLEKDIRLPFAPINSLKCPLCGTSGVLAGQEKDTEKKVLMCVNCTNRIQ